MGITSLIEGLTSNHADDQVAQSGILFKRPVRPIFYICYMHPVLTVIRKRGV
jgi:hypothetical protein